MSNRSWRGTVLFTVILVVMGATVGVKLYGAGEEAVSAPTSITSTAAAGSGSESESESGSGSTPTTPSPSPSASTDSGSTSSSDSSGSSASSSATTTVTGSAVDTRYGAVQVRVTLSGSTITAVDALQSPDRDGRDIAINQRALPILEQEVLASQSASIDTVSGATYTSEGYIQSLQSALDQR